MAPAEGNGLFRKDEAMYRILLVDDEPELLMTMANRLEVVEEFSVDCASDGYEAALKALDTSYDCIFLDIMMPHLNGLEVCRKLRANPETANTPVIITTALSDEETVHKAIRMGASDYLVKPFQGNLLVEKARKWTRHKRGQKTSQTAWDRSTLDQDIDKTELHKPKSRILEKIFKELEKPIVLAREEQIVARINEIIHANGETLPTVDLLAADLMTAADIFRLANSAFIGARSRVAGFADAVRRLGLKTIQESVSRAAAIRHQMNPTARRFIRAGFWNHCLATACLAEEIAGNTQAVNREESYTAGLFHDIGKLFLISYFPDMYMDTINRSRNNDRELSELEKSVFGIDHGQLGCLILKKWHFPRSIQEACLHYKEPDSKGDQAPTIPQVVWAADTLNQMLVDTESRRKNSLTRQRFQLLAETVNLPFEHVINKMRERVNNIAAQLQIVPGLKSDQLTAKTLVVPMKQR
jgi:putative nucleotidyltransferase with HDIG domain